MVSTTILVSVVVFAFTLAAVRKNTFVRFVDFFFYDQLSRQSVSSDISNQFTIVDIDETSLSAVGQWPWPRYRLAQLVNAVSQQKPRAIGLDIIFPEADRTSLSTLQQQFKRDFDLEVGFTGVPQTLTDNDGFFAYTMRQTRTVGARYFYFDHFNRTIACRDNVIHFKDAAGRLDLHEATGVLCNTPMIETSLTNSGYMNNQHDPDGVLRKTPLLIRFNDEIFPHLSLSTFMQAEGITEAVITRDIYGPVIEAGRHRIPITETGYFRMRFNGPGHVHRYISAVDILNNEFNTDALKDKIVFIGSSAVGLNDIHHTIFDSQFPGIEVHATILENITNQDYIVAPVWSKVLVVAACILTGLVLTVLFFLSGGPLLLLLGVVIWTVLLLTAGLASYFQLSVFISPGLPLLLSIILFMLFSLLRFALEKRAAYIWYKKLVESQQLTLRAMVSMVETRDPETGEHIKRTQNYARAIATRLKQQGLYPDTLTDYFITTLYLSVPMHDIGKVGIPDNILMKKGKLTDEEYEIMKTHAVHGRDIINRAAEEYQMDDYLCMSAEVAGSHHERWDGKGYPDGIQGDRIPLSGRIMAIADVYDALISRRCYKPPFSHEKSIGIITEERGVIFDPTIVDAFLAIEPEIKAIATEFSDDEVASDE